MFFSFLFITLKDSVSLTNRPNFQTQDYRVIIVDLAIIWEKVLGGILVLVVYLKNGM